MQAWDAVEEPHNYYKSVLSSHSVPHWRTPVDFEWVHGTDDHGIVHHRILGVPGVHLDDEDLLTPYEEKAGIRKSKATRLDPDNCKPYGSRATAGRCMRERDRYFEAVPLACKCAQLLADGTGVNSGVKQGLGAVRQFNPTLESDAYLLKQRGETQRTSRIFTQPFCATCPSCRACCEEKKKKKTASACTTAVAVFQAGTRRIQPLYTGLAYPSLRCVLRHDATQDRTLLRS